MNADTRLRGGLVRSFVGHPLMCQCPQCSEDERLRALKITRAAPTASLDSQSVSLQELVDNATLTLPHTYEVGEDWNDD